MMKRIVLNVLVFSLFASSLCAREYEEEPFDKESDRMARKHGDAEYEYQKQLAREAKMQQKAERKARRAEQREEKDEECRLKRQKMLRNMKRKEKKRAERVKMDCIEKKELAARWRDFREVEDRHDRELGRYADLYKQPARPTYATRVAEKYLFNVGFDYSYAHDSYGSSGANQNITRLAFGEGPILVQDLLLVSKLAASGIVIPNDFSAAANQVPIDTASTYLSDLATQPVRFSGKAEGWGLNLDLSRYVFCRNVVFGVQVPVVYKNNKLKVSMDQSAINSVLGLVDVGGAGNPVAPNAFMRRYGQDTGKFLADIFRAKGMSQIGGSAMGLGDVTVFAHATWDVCSLDNLMVGARFLIPTAKKATQAKLWAPEMGNGGFFEGTLFTSVGMFRNWYTNPHLFLQATFSSQAHVDRRVPKRVSSAADVAADIAADGTHAVPGNPNITTAVIPLTRAPMSFVDRVQLAANQSFDTFDTTFRGLSDNVANLKITKGQEFNVRVGNIFEEVMLRRGFLDIFYDFRAKLADGVTSKLDKTVWNTDIYKQNTQQIEHKGGFEWSYQFEESSRLRVGADYTFAGRNVAKLFAAHLMMNCTF